MEKETKTYKQNMHCANCGNRWVKDFEAGYPCRGEYECPNCGCRDARSLGKPKDIFGTDYQPY